MPRVKRGVGHVKRRKNLLAKTKGFKWGRKSKIKLAKTAAFKAGAHAYRDRRNKKRRERALWQIRISAFAKSRNLSYSKLMNLLKINKINLNRKVLSELAMNHESILDGILGKIK